MTDDSEQPKAARRPSRLDRNLYDSGHFPSSVQMLVRFDDVDTQYRVDNPAAIAYMQEARSNFHRSMDLPKLPKHLRTVVAAMNVEHAVEITYPATIEVSTAMLDVGRTSYTFAQRIRLNGKSAVYSKITMVVTSLDGGPAPMPSEFASALQKLKLTAI